MDWEFFKPKQPGWMKASVAIALASLALYAGLAWWLPWAPGRLGGLTFGSLAAAVFVLDALYPLRRRLLAWPFGNAIRWLQFHLYGGALACLFVFLHIGFAWPAGTMGWWLLGLSLWVTGSGALGVALQKWLPAVITGSFSVEAIYERIPEMTQRLLGEADELLQGCSEGLEQIYVADIRPLLVAPAPSWSYVFDARLGRNRRLGPLRDVAPFIGAAERERLDDLTTLVNEKLELDAHYSLQRALKAWVLLHVPPAFLLLGLLCVHIYAVLVH
jgi:hypothetical protein